MTADYLKAEKDNSMAELKQAMVEWYSGYNKMTELINKDADPIHFTLPPYERVTTALARLQMYNALYKREISEG